MSSLLFQGSLSISRTHMPLIVRTNCPPGLLLCSEYVSLMDPQYALHNLLIFCPFLLLGILLLQDSTWELASPDTPATLVQICDMDSAAHMYLSTLGFCRWWQTHTSEHEGIDILGRGTWFLADRSNRVLGIQTRYHRVSWGSSIFSAEGPSVWLQIFPELWLKNLVLLPSW